MRCFSSSTASGTSFVVRGAVEKGDLSMEELASAEAEGVETIWGVPPAVSVVEALGFED